MKKWTSRQYREHGIKEYKFYTGEDLIQLCPHAYPEYSSEYWNRKHKNKKIDDTKPEDSLFSDKDIIEMTKTCDKVGSANVLAPLDNLGRLDIYCKLTRKPCLASSDPSIHTKDSLGRLMGTISKLKIKECPGHSLTKTAYKDAIKKSK